MPYSNQAPRTGVVVNSELVNLPFKTEHLSGLPQNWPPVSDLPHTDFTAFGVPNEYYDLITDTNTMSQRFSIGNETPSLSENISMLSGMTRLLQRLIQTSPPSDLAEPSLNLSESCRYAGILHVCYPLSGAYPDPSLFVTIIVHRLKARLVQLQDPSISRPLLLWLYAVGATSSAWREPRLSAWFVGHLSLIVDDLGISSWNEMKTTLTSVMRFAIFCETSFFNVWKAVVALKTI